MRLIIVGFGTVGQGLAELLVGKKELLSKAYGLEPVVVGISDEMKGSATNPAGLDLSKALELVGREKLVSDMEAGAYEGSALDMIRDTDADVMLEATYTNIKTGEPATSHIKAALEKGIHVVTTNKGPLALHYQDLVQIAKAKSVQFSGKRLMEAP
jgi:homoserine dehydrogenase